MVEATAKLPRAPNYSPASRIEPKAVSDASERTRLVSVADSH